MRLFTRRSSKVYTMYYPKSSNSNEKINIKLCLPWCQWRRHPQLPHLTRMHCTCALSDQSEIILKRKIRPKKGCTYPQYVGDLSGTPSWNQDKLHPPRWSHTGINTSLSIASKTEQYIFHERGFTAGLLYETALCSYLSEMSARTITQRPRRCCCLLCSHFEFAWLDWQKWGSKGNPSARYNLETHFLSCPQNISHFHACPCVLSERVLLLWSCPCTLEYDLNFAL